MLLVLFVFNVMFRVIVLAIVLVLVLLPVPVLVQQPGIFVFFPGSLSCLYNLFYTSSLSMCCMGFQIFYLERISTCIAGVYLLADCNVEGGKCSNCTLALLELYDDPPSSPSLSSLFVNCVLSILAKLQFDIFYIHSSHNMFRGRASCFRKTDKTFQQTKNGDIF